MADKIETHWQHLGFKYVRINEVIVFSVLGYAVFLRAGDAYSLFGVKYYAS